MHRKLTGGWVRRHHAPPLPSLIQSPPETSKDGAVRRRACQICPGLRLKRSRQPSNLSRAAGGLDCLIKEAQE
ncbi:hypothetical protein GCM10007919_16650 [Rhizobium indigoferae]|nr:hypothetical protein GCM10007919_16650 [Rhizobium indigoferae]